MYVRDRNEEASVQDEQQTRQVKARVSPEDGMEEELRQEECAARQPDMQLYTMQTNEAFEASLAAQQGDQPSQQSSQLALVSFEEGAAVEPAASQISALAAIALQKQEERRQKKQYMEQHKQRMQQLDAEEKAARAAGASHAAAAPMQPPTQPSAHPGPKQTSQLEPKQPKTQPAKQKPKQQPPQQATQQKPTYAAKVVAATCGAMASAVCQSLLPTPKQSQPKAQQRGQWQQQNHQRKAQHSTQNKQQQRPVRGAVGLDRLGYQLHFTLSGDRLETSGSPREVVGRVVAEVAAGAEVQVVDVARLGPGARPRFVFKVATLEQADVLVRGRGRVLAGSGVVLSEVLSEAEAARHAQLYPTFLELKRAGHKVQFRRARLFVDGKLWSGTRAG
jgi:hypothetical protein